MATSSDWAQHEDSNATSLPVDTPDLFGGVLFGDELIDMYNSEAVVGEHSHGEFCLCVNVQFVVLAVD